MARLRRFGARISPREWVMALGTMLLLAIAPSMAQIGSSAGPGLVAEGPEPVIDASNLGSVERPEDNFPGSAFYFIADDFAPARNEGMFGDAAAGDGSRLAAFPEPPALYPGVGPTARPLVVAGSTQDRSRALKCLSDAIYYEAGIEPDAGQRAVAQVILNRVAHPAYPSTVCGVVYQGSERASGCQFSYSCDGSMRRRPDGYFWERAERVARDAIDGFVYAPASLATHYHTTEVKPYWMNSLDFLGTIGAHRFYRWKGEAGQPAAFSAAYGGGEPLPGPKARTSVASAPDPVRLQQRYEASHHQSADTSDPNDDPKAAGPARQAGAASAAIAPTLTTETPSYARPDYSDEALKRGGETAFAGEKLPQSGTVKDRYKSSGTWKKKPEDF